jgi:hypothetical protein
MDVPGAQQKEGAFQRHSRLARFPRLEQINPRVVDSAALRIALRHLNHAARTDALPKAQFDQPSGLSPLDPPIDDSLVRGV